jgi:hypothetical protein
MGAALVTLPDGQRARITFTDQAQLDATVADLAKDHPAKPKAAAAPAPKYEGGLATRLGSKTASDAVEDVGRSVAQGAAADIVGSAKGAVAGLATGVEAYRTGDSPLRAFDKGADAAADEITDTKRAMAYEPKTEAGKATMGALAAGADKVREFAKSSGLSDVAERASDALRDTVRATALDLGVSPEIAERLGPAVQAAAKTYLEAKPAEVLGGRMTPEAGASKLTGAAAARDVKPKPRIEPTLEPQAPPTAQAAPAAAQTPPPQLSASGAPRQPYSNVGAGPASKAAPIPPTEAKAAAYARSIGLDWSRLGLGMRKALTSVAQDATALEKLDPAAVKREALLQSQRVPVPATRGQLTRDPAELRREAIVSRTQAGQPIRDVDIAANKAVQSNLEALRGRAAGLKGGLHDPLSEEGVPSATPSIRATTKLPTQVGEAAQNAVREKQKWSKKGYDALFKKARETEPSVRVPSKPLKQMLDDNPSIQHLGFVRDWLAKAAKTTQGGEHVTLNELMDLRQKATALARAGGTEGHYAGEVLKEINGMMDQVPESAKAWRTAIKAFKDHQAEFKDQDTVRQLVSQTKAGGNPALALEKTWNKVAKGPLENLRQVKRTMLTGGTPKIREMGRRAWRDMRGETVNRILEDARNVVATDETEREILTAAALQKSINSIPRENLEELIGKANVRELKDILRTAKITRTQPAARVTESGTVPNLLVMAEKILGHIPGGKLAIGAAKGVKTLKEMGSAGETVRRATTSPLQEAASKARPSRKARRTERAATTAARLGELESLGPTLPGPPPQPTIGSITP